MKSQNRVSRVALSVLVAGAILVAFSTVYAAVTAPVAMPEMNPRGMTFNTASLPVTLTCATSGAFIRYTTDGSDPSKASKYYSSPVTVPPLTGSTTLKAMAFKGTVTSATTIYTYTKDNSVKVLAVSPNKLQYAPGEKITFTGILKTTAGTPVTNTRIGIDDSLSQICTLGPTTDSKGNFTYQVTVPSLARGNYDLTFYGGNSPVYAVITVKPTKGLQLADKNFSIPLGVGTSASSFNVALTAKLANSTGMPRATQSQQQSALTAITSFMADAGKKSLNDYVSNPVNDVVAVGSVGCVAGIWTGIGTIPCAALYTYDLIAGAKSAVFGVVTAGIDKSNLSNADKLYWKDMAKAGKCVIGIVMLDPSSAAAPLSSVAGGWTCGSAVASIITDSSNKKALKVVALPPTNGPFQTGVGFVLLQK